MGILWNLGAEAGVTLFVDAAAYRSARYPNFGMGLSLGIIESWFDAESDRGTTRTALTTLPALFELRQRFVAGRTFLALGAGAGFAMCSGRMQSYGATVTGHGYGGALEASVESGFLIGDASLVFALRYLAVFIPGLSSGDRIAGNAAGAVADIGYRLNW